MNDSEGYYHICTDGLSRKLLFRDTDDYVKGMNDIPACLQQIKGEILCFSLMPNHVHFLLEIEAGVHGRAMHAPTISRIVQHWKGNVSKAAGRPLWQKSFHDHVIRNDVDLANVRQYIRNNPLKWIEDKD